MTHNDCRDVINNLFINAAIIATTQYTIDNESFTPPVGKSAWINFYIKFMTGKQITIGIRSFRHVGYIWAQVYTISDSGTYANDIYCQNIKNIFEGASSTGIRFDDASIVTLERTGKWYQQNVKIRFEFDEVR